MKHKITLVIVALMAVVAGYCYVTWPDVRYLVANAQTRQRLDTEQLQRGYSVEAKAFEQRIKTVLKTDPDIANETKKVNELSPKLQLKYDEMLRDQVAALNKQLTARSRNALPSDTFSKVVPKLPVLVMKEIRLDSVSYQPTSIRTDEGDLIKRYHADVKAAFSIVIEGGDLKPPKIPGAWEASASPDKRWTFPTTAEVKDNLVKEFDVMIKEVESTTEATIEKQKLELKTSLAEKQSELELEDLKRHP